MARRREYTLERFAQEAKYFTHIRFEPLEHEFNQSFRYSIHVPTSHFSGTPADVYPLIIHDAVDRKRLEILGVGHVHARIKGPRKGSRYQITVNSGSVEVSRLSRVYMSKPDDGPLPPVVTNCWTVDTQFGPIQRCTWTELPRFIIFALIDPSERLELT